MRSILLALGAVLLVAAAPPLKPQPASQGLQLIDLTDEFDRAWADTRNVPDERRVEAFQEQFEAALPGFYSAARVSDLVKPERYRAMLLAGLKDYESRRGGILRVGAQFQELIAPAQREFEAQFGPMRGYPPIYLVHSFGEFDGGTRDLGQGTRLMFGADMIDQLYQGRSAKPFVQHELFHLMHDRTFKACEKIWCNLWSEGLATYLSARINPGADDAELGLTLPKPIRPAVEANRRGAICAVRSRLDSEKPDDYAPLFYGNRNVEGFPPRMGYFVGYLVAERIGRGRSLRELASLTPAEVQPLIIEALDNLAHCSG